MVKDDMESSLTKLGFNEELPFDIKVAKSQFSNTDKIEKEIQLADSGYGQGQILVNPLHMACMYSAFCNEGNMIKPYLTYKEDAIPERLDHSGIYKGCGTDWFWRIQKKS